MKKVVAVLAAAGLVMVAGVGFGAGSAMADSVWVQSYERSSQTAECETQAGETPWQASWGTDSSWKPTWEQWANDGQGGWTCTRSINWARTPPSYAVGDIGPGGGLIFLISGGLRYEMAPKTWSGGAADPTMGWCDFMGTSIAGAAGTAVGTGSANTTAMLAVCTSGAANSARAYAGGGQTDWFLPSKDELDAMYLYQGSIVDTATYGFASASYWTSTQYDIFNAWVENLDNRGQLATGKGFKGDVRPVRAF